MKLYWFPPTIYAVFDDSQLHNVMMDSSEGHTMMFTVKTKEIGLNIMNELQLVHEGQIDMHECIARLRVLGYEAVQMQAGKLDTSEVFAPSLQEAFLIAMDKQR